MKHLKLFFLLAVSTALFTACKKDKDEPINVPASMVEGKYVGKYGTGNNNPASFFSFNLKTGGVLEELNSNSSVVGTGTWSISGETFKGKYTTILPIATYSVKAIFDITNNRLTGTWGYGLSETDGGKWYMDKN